MHCGQRLDLDDDLLKTARELTGMTRKSALVREALRALVEREAARRLAALGGASPEMEQVPRKNWRVGGVGF